MTNSYRSLAGDTEGGKKGDKLENSRRCERIILQWDAKGLSALSFYSMLVT
jgi:hypothetical protein